MQLIFFVNSRFPLTPKGFVWHAVDSSVNSRFPFTPTLKQLRRHSMCYRMCYIGCVDIAIAIVVRVIVIIVTMVAHKYTTIQVKSNFFLRGVGKGHTFQPN